MPLTPAPSLFHLCSWPVLQGSTISWHFFLQHAMAQMGLNGTTQPHEVQDEYPALWLAKLLGRQGSAVVVHGPCSSRRRTRLLLVHVIVLAHAG